MIIAGYEFPSWLSDSNPETGFFWVEKNNRIEVWQDGERLGYSEKNVPNIKKWLEYMSNANNIALKIAAPQDDIKPGEPKPPVIHPEPLAKTIPYLNAVSNRKSYSHKTGAVNMAALLQLENNDIPLIIQITRALYAAIEGIATVDAVDDEPHKALVTLAQIAYNEAENLAANGNLSYWGASSSNAKSVH